MQGVNIEQIKQVLKFIYLGSVQIENDQLEAFYETRSRLKIDETEMKASENNAKGEDVPLTNAETIKIRESVIVSRSERLDNDTKKRDEKDDLTCANLEPRKKLDNIADAILAEEEKRLHIFEEEPIEDGLGLEVEEDEMGSARGQTTEEDTVENNVSAEPLRAQTRGNDAIKVRGKEASAGGLEDQKVKVEVVDDLNMEQIVDDNLLERFPSVHNMVNTWKELKEKELKQELLGHSEHSLETPTTQIPSRENRKRKRYRGNSWRRTKRTKVVTIKSEDPSSLSVEDKSVEDKHSIGIELNPFHDANTEKAIKSENQSNTNTIKTSQAENETITPAPKKVKVKSLPLVTRRSTRASARAAQVLFVELFGKI